MATNLSSLADMSVGQRGRVVVLKSCDAIRQRMLDFGLIVATTVEAVHVSPAGDPKAYSIRGAVIALRSEIARQVIVSLDD